MDDSIQQLLFLFGRRRCRRLRSIRGGVALVHRRLEIADPFAQSLAQIAQLLGAENQQDNNQDHQQVHGLEQAFHTTPQEPPGASTVRQRVVFLSAF